MIFSKIFQRNKKKKEEKESDFDLSQYAKLETEEIVQELNQSDAVQAKNYVVDLCKQMIQASKDIEDNRSEYQLVTKYLNDIQIIEDLTDEEKKPIAECASHVCKLEKQRTDYLQTERRLTESQYAQMQEEEENIPGVIKRLKENETDLDTSKRNMAVIEGKKLEWSMQRSAAVKNQKIMRTAACYLFVIFLTFMALCGILSWYFVIDLQLVMTIIAIAAVLAGAFILIRYQDSSHCVRQMDVNRNHAITVENHVKIRYVNTKNAVDYTCEKYHVRNAKELEYFYGQYLDEARERENFRKTSSDLEYYTRKLLQYLNRLRMYDTRVWLTHANAIVDSREMVELKHELIKRRQKIRSRVEKSVNSIREMKGEAYKNLSKMGDDAYQVERILRKIEEVSPVA
ncbi:MAG: hypothetical protein PUF81_09215 [Lachnospiraceae bacterium]|nr:hypothetical protein [Lachnospiraceae bacterium]